MKKKRIKIAMAQMKVVGGAFKQNMHRAVSMIKNASEKNCDIVVLPECIDLGWTYPDAPILALPIPGKSSDMLCKNAQNLKIYIVAGLTEKDNDKIYNSAILISPEGEIILKHRKINILEIAQNIYSIGNSLSVADTALGKIGINICADNFPDSLVLGHSLFRMGADMLLSPSSWAVESDEEAEKSPLGLKMWRNTYTTLAYYYSGAVIGVSNVGYIHAGVWKGKKCIGNSLAVGPDGNILAEGPYGEDAEKLIIVSVNIVQKNITGTAIAEMLKEKGYEGP